jgi:hypothetical protein
MLFKNISICCQLITDKHKYEDAAKCYMNPPCGCANPGKELQCENCDYLESCLSKCQQFKNSQKNSSQKNYGRSNAFR